MHRVVIEIFVCVDVSLCVRAVPIGSRTFPPGTFPPQTFSPREKCK